MNVYSKLDQIQTKLIEIETDTTCNSRSATRSQEDIQQLKCDMAILKIDITDIKEIVKKLEKNLQK